LGRDAEVTTQTTAQIGLAQFDNDSPYTTSSTGG
jgi:hypothetical protein